MFGWSEIGWTTIGPFYVASGTVKIADPCYIQETTDDLAIRLSMAPGWYMAHALIAKHAAWGARTASLLVQPSDATSAAATRATIAARPVIFGPYIDAKPNISLQTFLPETRGEIGVDSGRIVILDEAHIPIGGNVDEWYEQTRAFDNGSIANEGNPAAEPTGVHVFSGVGDGHYPFYIAEDEGNATGIFVDFLPEERASVIDRFATRTGLQASSAGDTRIDRRTALVPNGEPEPTETPAHLSLKTRPFDPGTIAEFVHHLSLDVEFVAIDTAGDEYGGITRLQMIELLKLIELPDCTMCNENHGRRRPQ